MKHFLENVRKEIPEGEYEEGSEIHRVLSVAQTNLETAQMYGVKGIAKMLNK